MAQVDLKTENLAETMRQTSAADGALANIYTLENKQGTKAVFMDIGAHWLSCQVKLKDGRLRETLLGRKTMEAHLQQSSYLGATVGRYANRIKDSTIKRGDQTIKLDPNQGSHQLHGGPEGFDKKRWNAKVIDNQTVKFSLVSEDGDQGFPGRLLIELSYHLSDDNRVTIDFKAKLDDDFEGETVINLTNHAYFNLDQTHQSIKQHHLQLFSDYYLPTDSEGIPLNTLVPVDGTGFDFRVSKTIEHDFLKDQDQKRASGYDHSYLIDIKKIEDQEPFAILTSSDKLLTMKALTNKPAVQLYTGNFLANKVGDVEALYPAYAGLCLETQFLPDSPNHPEWQQACWLKAGLNYHYWTSYQFIAN